MKRQKNDITIFAISVVINLLILFLIPGLRVDKIIDKKLKVGIVTLESSPQKVTQKATPPKVTPKVEPKKTTVTPPPVKEEKKPEPKPQPKPEPVEKKLSLDDLAKSITKRETEFLAVNNPSRREINNDLVKELNDKKDLNEVQKKESVNLDNNISLVRENDILDRDNNQISSLERDINFQSDNNELAFNSMVKKSKADGLPTGYRLGVEDGDIIAKWDTGNREPKYPEAAQLRGMQGKVLLKIDIDETGKVVSVFIEKGSGVPEINQAIEEIARTWRIYLSKNGLNIRGNVTLEYSFKLLGRTS